MSESTYNSITEFLSNLAKNITNVGIILGLLYFLMKPYMSPFYELPEKIERLDTTVSQLKIVIDDKLPEYVSYKGGGLVHTDTVEAGGTFRVSYTIKRNFSCKRQIEYKFYNLDKNIFETHLTITVERPARPASTDYEVETFVIPVPAELESGLYSFVHVIHPIGCGNNKSIVSPLSEEFQVKGK